MLMASFLKQSFAQTCLKEVDNGKLQQFNYSRSLITNRGTVERGKIHSAHARKQNKHNNCTIKNYFLELITLYMKLSWFCHTNSGQSFCNCPLFVIALVPGLFFGEKPDETCCHSIVASKWLETRVSHFALQDENTTT